MKKLTSFAHLVTGEGDRIAFTYSEIDKEGNLISQNNKGNFIIVDSKLKEHIDEISKYITENKLN
ncbi:Uncharacterised protein [uncultured Clostridium sp.]|uniref:Uncharacterized protein n=1 Tax=Muricoprocola aceti TaxID=2981772 RepID=A0ABT2SNB2_9FIRM|nr:hypothetical protein [Muricoprocola aceti]MCU6725781.1 hypothetical protein [Muricoprocola aceti]SCH64174.1 Uncharacterised protein [uncultured Clostridium sp.]